MPVPPGTTYAVATTPDPAAFLAEAAEHLAADPVLTTVVATVTRRAAEDDARGVAVPDHPRWWATVRDPAGVLVGAAMRTAPFGAHPPYVLPMPDGAARALARHLHARGEEVAAVNGALPAARVVADELAELTGGAVTVVEHLRLWEAREVVPHTAPGRLRPAGRGDVPRCTAWFATFDAESAEQAGRAPVATMGEATEEEVARRVDAGQVWLWESEAGEVVHLTAHSAPAYGVVRVGPVITPREHRRRGYAGAAVAAVTARLLGEGHRACLFTDLANPTSNRLYASVGYRPLADTVNLTLTRPGRP